MSVVSLGTQIADPAKRLAYVKAATAAMKANIGQREEPDADATSRRSACRG